MKKISIGFIIILLSLTTTSAQAEIYAIDETLEKCTSKNYMTMEMNKCTYDGIESWNKEIIRYSDEIQKILSKEELKTYNDSQKAWKDYYKKEKDFLYSTIYKKDGDIHTTFVISNLYELTKQRALCLKQYLQQLSK